MVVVLDEHNNVLLKKEYRYLLQDFLIELPAGTFEPGETDGLVVAIRELLEETGYTSDDWIFLSSTVKGPSKVNNHLHLYLAKNINLVADQKLDATEEIEVIKVPLKQTAEMCLNSEIVVNRSVNGILRVARMIGV